MSTNSLSLFFEELLSGSSCCSSSSSSEEEGTQIKMTKTSISFTIVSDNAKSHCPPPPPPPSSPCSMDRWVTTPTKPYNRKKILDPSAPLLPQRRSCRRYPLLDHHHDHRDHQDQSSSGSSSSRWESSPPRQSPQAQHHGHEQEERHQEDQHQQKEDEVDQPHIIKGRTNTNMNTTNKTPQLPRRTLSLEGPRKDNVFKKAVLSKPEDESDDDESESSASYQPSLVVLSSPRYHRHRKSTTKKTGSTSPPLLPKRTTTGPKNTTLELIDMAIQETKGLITITS